MANQTMIAQADGLDGLESGEEMSRGDLDRRAGVGNTYECSYCGTEYVKKDRRQVLCLHCTVENYL